MSISSLPIVDLSLAEDPSTAEQFRATLRDATHDVGFFYLIGHGVDPTSCARVTDVARDFFALPDEEKLAVENVHSPHFRGYTRLGGELTGGTPDWREVIDIGPDRDPVTPFDDAAPWEILEGPNLWPASLPELKSVMTEWNTKLTDVAMRLLRQWALALGQEPDVFDAAFAENPSTLIKVVRYPARHDESASQGVGGHKDSGVLTLLFVEPGRGGLQVEHDGQWVDADPVDGALIVNIGELLEFATSGYLKATVHRVVSPHDGRDRISIPFFFNPALSARIPRLELPAELAARAAGVTEDVGNAIHDTYGANALKSRLRAHPDVAAIHHPDLIGPSQK
ncbi:isopenicillin N synthase family oxygenase [Mycobacterium yunnanensis]|uniref:Isopenicillin N synthase family oxygenase n=1 Tax=Mycobacterium yunnanensis TaxID=368477 RepID=A0A9X2Z888_9MYCO|nr:2-oxoglutarate and iron-dependent oxygenase domain-containing protein [Mycobacterium yunnanensis]MCV7424066.1 isopenicillin N synthase family oxygenase [Mycobacterium yunnanensis]